MKIFLKKEITELWLLNLPVLLIFSMFIGFRNESVGTDTHAYIKFYNLMANNSESRISEPLFVLFTKMAAFSGMGHVLYLVVISFLSLFFLMCFVNKLVAISSSNNRKATYLFVLFSLSLVFFSPFFINSQINVLRSGLSIPLIFLSGYYLYVKNSTWFLIFSIAATLIQYTSIIFIVSIWFLFKLRTENLIFIYLFGMILYVSTIMESTIIDLVTSLDLDVFLYYLKYFDAENSNYEAGVRYDFLGFTSIILIVSYLNLVIKKDFISRILFYLYISLSMPFLFLGFISYSDRLLLPAWSLIPFVLSYFVVSNIKIEKFYVYYMIFVVLLSAMMTLLIYKVV